MKTNPIPGIYSDLNVDIQIQNIFCQNSEETLESSTGLYIYSLNNILIFILQYDLFLGS